MSEVSVDGEARAQLIRERDEARRERDEAYHELSELVKMVESRP